MELLPRRRAGRPRKAPQDQRTVTMTTHVTHALAAAFQLVADEQGLAASSVLRGLCYGYANGTIKLTSSHLGSSGF